MDLPDCIEVCSFSTTSPSWIRSCLTVMPVISVKALASVLLSYSCVVMVSRSEEHTSELQSPCNLVCRLLLEKKKNVSCIACGAELTSGARRIAPFSRHLTQPPEILNDPAVITDHYNLQPTRAPCRAQLPQS